MEFKAMYENPNLEGQRPMPDSTETIADVLKSKGYKTGMVGKWGLGAPNTNSIPNKKGFDFFMAIIVSDKLIIYSSHLWRNTERHVLNNTIVNKGKLPLISTLWKSKVMPYITKMIMPHH